MYEAAAEGEAAEAAAAAGSAWHLLTRLPLTKTCKIMNRKSLSRVRNAAD
jgi:hypothetical protein